MPPLTHCAQYERHLTLAALAHCPRDYDYIDRMRRGLLAEDPQSESLSIGILVHTGLAALWKQRMQPGAVWTPSVALDAIDSASAGLDRKIVVEVRQGILDYASQWTGPRDHWTTLAAEPANDPPDPWTLLFGHFVSYPDLIVSAMPQYPVLVVDYKTSRWNYDPAKWEWNPELLTQCLAAEKLTGAQDISYMVDFLQRPGRKTTTWSFPVTQVWEFTEAKREATRAWIERGLAEAARMREQYGDAPWPRALSQCETPWGVCRHWGRCFGGAD